MKEIRVLHLTASPFTSGGIEIFLHNITCNMTDVRSDFLTTCCLNNNKLIEDLKQQGSEFIELNIDDRNVFLKIYKIIKRTTQILKTKHYQIVHIHSGSIPIIFCFVVASNRAHIPIKIFHSHNSYHGKKGIKQIILNLMKIYITNHSDYLFACSLPASKWMFTRNSCKSKCIIIKNGIKLEHFKYNKKSRKIYRKKYDLEGKIILGNIGRLTLQKNQIFLVQIVKSLVKKYPNIVLIIVGEGEEKEKLEKVIEKYNLRDHIQLWGERNDIPSILSMIDIFLLPSLWEGLGIVNIEAQVSGVASIVSNNVPPEAIFTDLVSVLPLTSQEFLWENEICRLINNGFKNRKSHDIEAKMAGYDAVDVASTLQNFYFSYKNI